MSQRRGRAASLGVHASVAIAIAGKSDRKLLSRICLGSSGRNGRNSDATAMLTMLPKLALVVMAMYFSVLAKVARPSSMPSAQHAEIVLEQDHVGRFLGHVDRAVHRDADVGLVQRRRVVDAVAEKPTTWPARLRSAATIRSFWLGSTSAKRSVVAREARQRALRSGVAQLGAR